MGSGDNFECIIQEGGGPSIVPVCADGIAGIIAAAGTTPRILTI